MRATRTAEPGHSGESLDALVERVRERRQLPLKEERRQIREAAGVSQRELARALGVSWTAIQRWEDGARPRQHVAEYQRALEELSKLAAIDPSQLGLGLLIIMRRFACGARHIGCEGFRF